MMDQSTEKFVLALDEDCKTHSDWMELIRFGMKSLLVFQPLLIELIVREARRDRQASRKRRGRAMARGEQQPLGTVPAKQLPARISEILTELGLHVEVTPTAPANLPQDYIDG